MFSSQTSRSGSQASPSKQYVKKLFVHFGFLVVEAWCAYGTQFSVVPTFRDRLAGDDSTAFLESILANERKKNSALTGGVVAGSDVKGFPSCRDRDLQTWPVNSMWTEFLLEIAVDDIDATCAADQLTVFYRAMKWSQGDVLQRAGFMACLQMWYFGMPVEQVCGHTICM
jgi:hypothetical protein